MTNPAIALDSVAIRFSLALRTVSEANRRGHWRKHADRTSEQRAAAFSATCRALQMLGVRYVAVYMKRVGKTMRPVCDGLDLLGWERATVTITRVAPRMLDDDNCASAMKAVRDGVSDSLNGGDDRNRITWCYSQTKGKPREYRVDVEIRRAA